MCSTFSFLSFIMCFYSLSSKGGITDLHKSGSLATSKKSTRTRDAVASTSEIVATPKQNHYHRSSASYSSSQRDHRSPRNQLDLNSSKNTGDGIRAPSNGKSSSSKPPSSSAKIDDQKRWRDMSAFIAQLKNKAGK